MAVEFTSHGYDTTATTQYTEIAWADAHPSIGLAKYGVRSPMHWKVTAVAGQDRTVTIAAGKGFGHGVTDSTYANDTIQLDTISSGSRWDMIAVRRDWTPTAGLTKFVKVNGGATAVIPGGRNSNPGGIDDQPLALVQVTAGQTQPTAIIDLRTWSGDGGAVVGAHDLVRTFLNATGTRLWINGIDWIRRVGANDTPEWVRVGDVTVADAGWALLPMAQAFNHHTSDGWSGLKVGVRSGWVSVTGAVSRATPWETGLTCAIVPAGLRPTTRIQGTNNAYVGPEGNISLAAGSGAVSFSLTWPLV